MWDMAGFMAASLVAEVADGSSNVREVWKLSVKQIQIPWIESLIYRIHFGYKQIQVLTIVTPYTYNGFC